MSTPSPTPAGGRVHLPRLADVVAERIREAILLGELQDGERLPPLDAMLEQFGVSAPSMREALRVLEAEGLIVVQRGGIGGAIVRRPTARTAAYTLALVLRSRGTEKGDVSDAVMVLEPACVRLCALRADRADAVVPELQTLNAAAEALASSDGLAFNDAMLDFHRAVVRLSGNETLAVVTRALGHISLADLRAWVSDSDARGEYPSPDVRTRELSRHAHITDLIEAGDAAGAEEAMRDHLDRSAHTVSDHGEPTVDPKTVRFSPLRD
jgi:GntR family transcriptional repressor for pyruvate dehydrogenase complex